MLMIHSRLEMHLARVGPPCIWLRKVLQAARLMSEWHSMAEGSLLTRPALQLHSLNHLGQLPLEPLKQITSTIMISKTNILPVPMCSGMILQRLPTCLINKRAISSLMMTLRA